jgi:hypothetical protein
MSPARSSCNTWATVRPRPLASRFQSTCDRLRFCGTGDCRVCTRSMTTGFSPAHTAKANCLTGQVRSTRRTWNRRPRKSESWVTRLAHVPAHVRDAPQREREDVKVMQELMRHANISVTLNIYAQAIAQTKRDTQSRVVSLLLDKNEKKTSTEADRTLTDVQTSGGDLQVVDKVGVPDGI